MGPQNIVTLLPRSTYESHNLDATVATLLQIPMVYLNTGESTSICWRPDDLVGGLMVDALRDLVNGGTWIWPRTKVRTRHPYMEQAVLELATGAPLGHLIGYRGNDDRSKVNEDRVLELIGNGFADPN